MQTFAVSEVSSGSYYYRNANNGTEADAAKLFFYMVTCDNLKESRIQCLVICCK